MLNGRRVDVRHSELALGAIDGEASKKMVSMVFHRNYNYIPRNCASWTDYYRKQRRLEHLKDVCVFVGLIILFIIASCI